jgi:hypothetical protein
MAQALQFTKAHSTLSIIDGTNNQWSITGQCNLTMVVGDGQTARYVLSGGNTIVKFTQSDIYKIAGSNPSGTPSTDFASLTALLPLYV